MAVTSSYLNHTPTASLVLKSQSLLRPARGAENLRSACLSVCMFVCLSVREHISGAAGPIFTNFLCRSPVAMARSVSGRVAIRYVVVVVVVVAMSLI